MSRLIAIVGSTASGKTALTHALAKELSSQAILAADSRQLYTGLDIGTAKPSPSERQIYNYQLLDLASIDKRFSLGDFVKEADQVLAKIDGTALIVGGTGFYLRGLLEGLRVANSPADPELRAELLALSLEELKIELQKYNPQALERIHSGDYYRFLRALEIAKSGEEERELPARECLWLGLTFSDRSLLQASIEARTVSMLSAGLIEETRALSELYGADNPVLVGTIGYKQVLAFLAGDLGQSALAAEISLRTRQYARRQLIWFRQNRKIHWIEASDCLESQVCQAMELIGGAVAPKPPDLELKREPKSI